MLLPSDILNNCPKGVKPMTNNCNHLACCPECNLKLKKLKAELHEAKTESRNRGYALKEIIRLASEYTVCS